MSCLRAIILFKRNATWVSVQPNWDIPCELLISIVWQTYKWAIKQRCSTCLLKELYWGNGVENFRPQFRMHGLRNWKSELELRLVINVMVYSEKVLYLQWKLNQLKTLLLDTKPRLMLKQSNLEDIKLQLLDYIVAIGYFLEKATLACHEKREAFL